MSNTIPSEHVRLLRQFISLCDAKPELIHAPELEFFRTWLSKLGATIPTPTHSTSSESKKESPKMETEDTASASASATHQPEEPPKVESDPESDLELENADVVQPDSDSPQAMGDPDVEVTDAMVEQASVKRGEAQAKLAEGAFEEAIALYTQAIENNPQSAILFAKRAQCFIKLQKPNAAIRDCNRALEINENSQQALKWRGKAHRMLGHWEAAYKDFCKAQLSDFDEEVQTWCKEVQTNAKKVSEHKRKYERRREEKELEAKRERIRKAQEEYAKAQKEEKERREREQQARAGGGGGHGFPGFPGGMGGMGGMPGMGGMGGMPGMGGMGGADLGGLGAMMSDPEILEALQDPDVQAAFADVSSDPSKLAAHQSNPKVRKVMEKLAKKFGGAGGPGAGGPMGGGFPNFPGGMGGGASSANDLD